MNQLSWSVEMREKSYYECFATLLGSVKHEGDFQAQSTDTEILALRDGLGASARGCESAVDCASAVDLL
jgi:hypothetical protein